MNELLELLDISEWLFPLFSWVGIFFFLGQISGWKSLAQLYPGRDISFHGKQTFRWQKVKIGKIQYNNAITIHTTIEGMQLEMPFMFRLNHPPIFIPWSMVKTFEKQRGLISISPQQSNISILINTSILDNNYTVPQSITNKLLNRTP